MVDLDGWHVVDTKKFTEGFSCVFLGLVLTTHATYDWDCGLGNVFYYVLPGSRFLELVMRGEGRGRFLFLSCFDICMYISAAALFFLF